jgi:hypothetical protein
MPATQKRILALVALVLALACATPAAAQWAWRDATGKMVFSDQPPPKSIPAKDILRQPATPAGPRYDAAAAAPSDSAADGKAAAEPARPAAKPASPTLADREIESRRRQQQLAEAQKKAAEEEARKAQQAENCERLRNYQRALDEGMRMSRINSAGEREILDDEARAAESARTRSQIEQHCR